MKKLHLHPYVKIYTSLLLITVFFLFLSCNKEFESQLEKLINTVYCPCGCVRETIKICTCLTAINIEEELATALDEGKTVEEIRTAYLERYGSQFYAVMEVKGINILAYLMPVVILIAIGGVIFAVRHQSRGNKVTTAQPDKQISEELQQHLETELEKYKNQN